MKTLQYLFFGAMATLLMAADCSNKDSEFYNDVYVSVPNLVDVADDDNYLVGEPVFITSSFSRLLNETGQSSKLDVYKTTGGARSFTFSYLIEKRGANDEWSLVNIEESNVVPGIGTSTTFGDFLLAQAVFDIEVQSYEYSGGITMTSAGDYRLSFTYNNGVSPNVVLISDSVDNNLFVNIYSYCEDTPGGYYYFTVN